MRQRKTDNMPADRVRARFRTDPGRGERPASGRTSPGTRCRGSGHLRGLPGRRMRHLERADDLGLLAWGWLHPDTSLDDCGPYIIARKPCSATKAADVTGTLELDASGCSDATVAHEPRPPGDNGASCVAAGLAERVDAKGMDHVRGAPPHPQARGEIARRLQTMKNRVLLENPILTGDLERQIGAFTGHRDNLRCHESLANLAPADVHHGRGTRVLKMTEEIRKQTIRKRRPQHQAAAAQTRTETEPQPPLR